MPLGRPPRATERLSLSLRWGRRRMNIPFLSPCARPLDVIWPFAEMAAPALIAAFGETRRRIPKRPQECGEHDSYDCQSEDEFHATTEYGMATITEPPSSF